jgi:hypothetical protein
MIYEYQKGKDSFWHPYFSHVNIVEMPCYWDDKYIEELDDPDFKDEIYCYRDEMNEDWSII